MLTSFATSQCCVPPLTPQRGETRSYQPSWNDCYVGLRVGITDRGAIQLTTNETFLEILNDYFLDLILDFFIEFFIELKKELNYLFFIELN